MQGREDPRGSPAVEDGSERRETGKVAADDSATDSVGECAKLEVGDEVNMYKGRLYGVGVLIARYRKKSVSRTREPVVEIQMFLFTVKAALTVVEYSQIGLSPRHACPLG